MSPADQDRKDFLDSLDRRGAGVSRLQLEILWHHFCNHALDWLLNKERVVDLGFVRLHPSIFRPHWWRTALWRMSLFGKWIREAREDKISGKQKHVLIRKQVKEKLTHVETLGIDKAPEGVIVRHWIELEYTDQWRKLTRKLERKRLKLLGPRVYATSIIRTLNEHFESNAHLFCQRVEDAVPARARLFRGSGQWCLGDNQSIGDKDEFFAKHDAAVVSAVVFPVLGYRTEDSPEEALPETDGELPAVPDLRPKTKDLRNRRPDVSQPEDWSI